MVIEGVIKSIKGKAARNTRGDYTTYIIELSNHPKNLSTFDDAVGKGLEVGKAYSFEVEQKGEYLNVVKGTMPEPIAFLLQGESEPLTQGPETAYVSSEADKNTSIQRQVALKAATDLVCCNIQHTSRKYAGGEAVLSIADQFALWLSGGPAPTFDPEQAERDKGLWDEQHGSGPTSAPVVSQGREAPAEAPAPSQPQTEGQSGQPEGDAPGEKLMRDAIREKVKAFGWKPATLESWCQQYGGANSIAEIPRGDLDKAVAWFQGK